MRWSFFVKPRWLLGHLVILVMVAVMVAAAVWQWDRLQERKADNAAIAAVIDEDPLEVFETAALDAQPQYRPVELRGTWQTDKIAYVRYPLLDGKQGYYVIAPFELASGDTITVNRGWIPQAEGQDDSVSPTSSLLEDTRITGLVERNQPNSGEVSGTLGTPSIPTVTSIDSAALEGLWQLDLPDNYVQLTGPAIASGPTLLPAPEMTEGSHFSYVLQWSAFAVVTLIGYAILLRKSYEDEAP